METEIIDEDWIEQPEAPRIWWESRRLKYNKVCLIVGVLILIISSLVILYSINTTSDLFSNEDLKILWGMGLIYFVLGNIAYTFTWILGSVFKSKISTTGRENLFVIFLILTLIPPVLLFIILLLLG